MRAAALVAAGGVWAACGGGGPPPAAPAPASTRVVTEDSDAEADDGVQVVSTRGRMEPAAIEAGLAPHTAAISACFTSQVGRRRWLGGKLLLHWDIARDGTAQPRIAESDLGAWPIERCVLEHARAATFAPPIGGDTDFSVPLEFQPRARFATWDADATVTAVGAQLAALDACERPAKGGKPAVPAPSGVAITLYVGPRGAVQSVGFAAASGPIDDAWAACAEQAALAWKLPDPRGTITKLAIAYR